MKSNYKKSWDDSQSEGDPLDRALDAALAKYASVEPRTGLEQRILAQLQAESARIPNRSWWQWSTVGLVAAVILFALALAWRSNKPAKVEVQRPSVPVERVPSATRVAANSEVHAAAAIRGRHNATRHQIRQATVVADGPKLDQFPSPEPLTPEELALVRYVRHFPQDAVIVASAQEEFEKEVEQEIATGRQATSNSIEEER
jgi:hypothetical protein